MTDNGIICPPPSIDDDNAILLMEVALSILKQNDFPDPGLLSPEITDYRKNAIIIIEVALNLLKQGDYPGPGPA